MKKRLLALSVATALSMGAGVANAFEIAENGIGMYNLVPYYTVQNGNVTLIQITNTDVENGKAVKVRFRGAEWSDDVLDFTVFLSPGDVWTGNISANAGIASLRTTDNSCTLPANVNQDFVTFRLQASDSAEAGTREGYVEIITMADIPVVENGDPEVDLYTTIKHVNGVAPCDFGVLSGLQPDQSSGLSTAGLDNPTGTLMTYAININVPVSKAFMNEAVAVNPDGDPEGAQNKLFFRQSNEGIVIGEVPSLTCDRIFGTTGSGQWGTGLPMFQFDMPDLTTPVTGLAPCAQRDEFTTALERASAVVEYVTDDAIQATTDVVFNQPTRRYYYVYDNSCDDSDGASEPAACTYNINGVAVDIEGEDIVTFGGISDLYSSLNGEANTIAVGNPDFWDREEDRFEFEEDIVISPTPPIEVSPISLKGEVAVVSLNNGLPPTGSLEAQLTAIDYTSILNGPDGWVTLSTTGADGALPVIGFTAIKLFNSGVGAAGTNYGMVLPLRTPVDATPLPPPTL